MIERGSQSHPLQAAPTVCLLTVPSFISFQTYISGIIVSDVKVSIGTWTRHIAELGGFKRISTSFFLPVLNLGQIQVPAWSRSGKVFFFCFLCPRTV